MSPTSRSTAPIVASARGRAPRTLKKGPKVKMRDSPRCFAANAISSLSPASSVEADALTATVTPARAKRAEADVDVVAILLAAEPTSPTCLYRVKTVGTAAVLKSPPSPLVGAQAIYCTTTLGGGRRVESVQYVLRSSITIYCV